jgi:hypothetical protein
VSCGAVHSQAWELVARGYTATLVAMTLAISRSSLYYRKKPRGSRADRTYDEQIVMACGEKLAYGHRRVTRWLQRKKGLPVNRKRMLRVMRERVFHANSFRVSTRGETLIVALRSTRFQVHRFCARTKRGIRMRTAP